MIEIKRKGFENSSFLNYPDNFQMDQEKHRILLTDHIQAPKSKSLQNDIEKRPRLTTGSILYVDVEEKIKEIKFIPINVCDFIYEEFNLDPMNANEAEKWLQNKLETLDVNNKIVMLKVTGELSSGKTSDIDFSRLKRLIIEKGALKVNLNRHNLKSKDLKLNQLKY